MAFGDQRLERGVTGPDVIELQLRLAGFRGSLWDGEYGPGTELQVRSFQRDVMGQADASGAVDDRTFEALFQFESNHPIQVQLLRCPCGRCPGFGQGRFKNEYSSAARTEANHRYEYPGMHKAVLHSYRAASFYLTRAGFPAPTINSGYRCWIQNEEKQRTSTNHMGKAIDLDFPMAPGEDKRDDANRCDRGRGLLVELASFQVGWSASNRKALEPADIAPTWIHMDVRNYEPRYLEESYFVLPGVGRATV